MKREESIEIKLYKDAERRRNEKIESVKFKTNPVSISDKHDNKNGKKDKYVYNKFDRDFNNCIENIKNSILNLDDLISILIGFGCINSNENIKLVLELWKILEGEKRKGVTKENFYKVLKAILKIPMNNNGNIYDSLFTSEGKIELSQKQINDLSDKFYLFWINKQNKRPCCNSSKREYSYKPTISKQSQKLARATQERVKGQYYNNIGKKVENRLLHQGKIQKEINIQKSIIKEVNEFKKNCTFTPNITKNYNYSTYTNNYERLLDDLPKN